MITHFKANRSPSLTDTIQIDGVNFDLTGSSVKFQMRLESSAMLKVNTAATIVNPPGVNGQVRYDWLSADVDTAGTYLAWWEVTLASGKTQNTPAFVLIVKDAAPSTVTDYADREELKGSSTLTGTTFADADIDLAITSASRMIDSRTGRRFFPDTDANQARYYTPYHARNLYVDDLITLTTLKTDQDGDGTFETTWTLNTDFVLEPLNAVADGWSFDTIRRTWRSTRRWPCWERSVEVTGKFGWVEPPEPIKQATLLLAARLVKRLREAPLGVAGLGPDGAVVRVSRLDADIEALIDDYIRKPLVA